MANAKLKITTPRGAVFTTTSKNGAIKAKLEWEEGFGPRKTRDFTTAQEFIDNEVLRFCAARVPFDTGMLQKSGILGTVVGSGEVKYIAPYAAYQYYNTSTSRGYDSKRGAYWFERGKITERERIMKGAARLAGGR